jgi:DNA-binding IscR family transcriptional regulator
MGLSYCSEEKPCPLHNEFKKVRNQITEMLYKITIGQFNEQLLEDQNSEEGTLMGHVLKR